MNGRRIASASLPIVFSQFFSGAATWNNPQSVGEYQAPDITIGISASLGVVTIGVNKEVAQLGIRYIVIGTSN